MLCTIKATFIAGMLDVLTLFAQWLPTPGLACVSFLHDFDFDDCERKNLIDLTGLSSSMSGRIKACCACWATRVMPDMFPDDLLVQDLNVRANSTVYGSQLSC